jgi:hypothetical protein
MGKFAVKNSGERYQRFKITILFNSGYGSKRWPMTMAINTQEEEIMNELQDLILDTFGVIVDMYSTQTPNCKVEDIEKGEQTEGLHDTSWENDGEKITLMDLLDATEDIPVENVSVEELKSHLLTWDGDEEEVKKIDKADLQYPILILVDDDGEFISIIDGHHRAQKASRKGLKTIKAKIIPINDLPKKIRKVFGHMGKQEQTEGELTEKCWKGYTQKGMKTMFGKRYPNCVKKKLTESTISPWVKRRFDIEELTDLVSDVKSLIDSGYDKIDAIYDTVRQLIATKQFNDINDDGTEREYWDSYLRYEEPLIKYVKVKLGI